MHRRKAPEPVADVADELRAADCSSGKLNGGDANPTQLGPQVIRAELVGGTTCTALGVTARGHAPILKLCRQLVAAGHDPRRPLRAYRGQTEAVHIPSIGEGATPAIED